MQPGTGDDEVEDEMTDSAGLKMAIFMMQKNEISLLPLFLGYNESLFGPSSLYLLDKGSTDSDVIATSKSFEVKGELFARLIQDLDLVDPHDF